MKKVILKYDKEIPESSFKELFQASLNYGIFDILVDDKYVEKIASIERISIYSYNIEHSPKFLILNEPTQDELKSSLELANKNNFFVGCSFLLKSKEDEQKIIKIAKEYNDLSFIIVKAIDWIIIPFENLIAELNQEDILLYAEVDSIKDAKTLLKTLEKGVDGIIIRPTCVNDILELKTLMGYILKIDLIEGEITELKDIQKADRVCVDTTSILHEGEGMLVGSTAKGFVLVHAEVFETEFVNSRPFRVNAGDVSAYVMVPSFNESGELIMRTNYLSELKAGDDVIICDVNGNVRIVSIGRVKIETRPMLLIKLQAKIKDFNIKVPINVILQKAETIRVVNSELKPISVVDLKKGDKILVAIGPGATHFGTSIKETIIEK